MCTCKAFACYALEALADGDYRHVESILLGVVEDEEQDGTANPPLLRPVGGWPGERPWWKS